MIYFTLTPSKNRPPESAARRAQLCVAGDGLGFLAAPFFFCLGFLASRLERFCSLLAIATSRQSLSWRICCGRAPVQRQNSRPPNYDRRAVHRLAATPASAAEAISARRFVSCELGHVDPTAASYARQACSTERSS